MKLERECRIIQEYLLPNYIEKLTDEDTNQYIEDHLKECDKCKHVLQDIKRDYELNEQKRIKRDVKYMKKFKNKLKVLRFIIVLIFLLVILTFSLSTARKMIIISNLSKQSQKYENSRNYHMIMQTYSDKGYTKEETFVMEDKIKTISTYVTDEGVEIDIMIR